MPDSHHRGLLTHELQYRPARFSRKRLGRSNKQLNVRIRSELEEGRSASYINLIDEITPIEPKDIHRHLAADQLNIKLNTAITEFLNCCHSLILNGLFPTH